MFERIKKLFNPYFGFGETNSDDFFIKNRKTYIRFCYIYGSFAQTAPHFRTPESDIDIICSPDIDEYEIRTYLKEKYPNIRDDITIDIKYRVPDSNGNVYYPINYWQSERFISLVDNKRINFIAKRDEINFLSVIRDPNKSVLPTYLKNNDFLDIKNIRHFNNSIKKHYGLDNFLKVLDESLLFYEKWLFRELLLADGKLLNKCSPTSLAIDRKNNRIIGNNKEYDYFTFYQECLGHNYFYAMWYTAIPTILSKKLKK